mmetsp:Transcript_21884/g.19921  ORF Transcript_21884/g.19921 Transcript_21884/m.19921 type:complete len:121 (+) Transcript_21884:109-471(+)
MSWFGLGGNNNKNTTESKTLTNDKIDYTNSSSDIEFSQPSSLSQNDNLPSLSTKNLEKEYAKEQEKLMVQVLMLKLADVSFDRCISNPSTSLSSTEKSCVNSIVNKYFESTEFVVGKLTR